MSVQGPEGGKKKIQPHHLPLYYATYVFRRNVIGRCGDDEADTSLLEFQFPQNYGFYILDTFCNLTYLRYFDSKNCCDALLQKIKQTDLIVYIDGDLDQRWVLYLGVVVVELNQLFQILICNFYLS